MSKISYPSSSPYASTLQSSWYIGNYVHRDIPSANDDMSIKITKKYENRPDILSYDLYGTPVYWWIFAIRNRDLLTDPVWDMITGIDIFAPSLNTLKKVLGE